MSTSERPINRVNAGSLHPRLWPVEVVFSSVPVFVAGRLRTAALRASGLRIGSASAFWGLPTLVGTGDICARLTVGSHCGFNRGCYFDLEDTVTIGDHVAVGHDVMFLTRSYEAGGGAQRAGTVLRAAIVIENGVWLGARATILPGVRIGAGSVIGASAVVDKDVPANTLLMGSQKVSIAKWR